jgi:hypothetical protein
MEIADELQDLYARMHSEGYSYIDESMEILKKQIKRLKGE